MDNVLQTTLLSYLDSRLHALFQQDNARCHIVRRTTNLFQEEGVDVYIGYPIHRI